MNEPNIVGVLQANRSLAHDLARICHIECSAVVNDSRQVCTLDQFHNEKVLAIDCSGVGSTDNVGMIYSPDCTHFLAKSFHGIR